MPELDLSAMLGQFAGFMFPIVLVAVILLTFLARYGYTIFKKCVSFVGAVAFGYIGSSIVAPLVLGMLGLNIEIISLPTVIGIVFAIIGALLMIYVYKLAIFFVGAAIGYFVAQVILVPLLSLEGVIAIAVSAVLAIVIGVIALLLFKPLFIIITSVFGMIGAGALTSLVLFPDGGIIFLAVFAVIGLIIGIVYAKKQFEDHEGQA